MLQRVATNLPCVSCLFSSCLFSLCSSLVTDRYISGSVFARKPDKGCVRLLTRWIFFGLDPLTWRQFVKVFTSETTTQRCPLTRFGSSGFRLADRYARCI